MRLKHAKPVIWIISLWSPLILIVFLQAHLQMSSNVDRKTDRLIPIYPTKLNWQAKHLSKPNNFLLTGIIV